MSESPQAKIRNAIQAKRREMDSRDKERRTQALEGRFLSWFQDEIIPKIEPETRIGIYQSFPFEIQTAGIQNWLKKAGFKVEFPEDASWNPAVVIVPGVAFSRAGDRIGLGKGFYDRYLASVPDRLRIALCFGFQVVENCHPNSWDQAMDFIVTEQEVISANRGLGR